MTLSNKTYDTLKWVAQILLPALGGLYFAFSDLWNLPKTAEVVGSIAAIDTFLGVLLGITASGYKKLNEPNGGTIQMTGVDPHTGMPDLALTLSQLPADLLAKKTVTLHVDPPAPFAPLTTEQAAAAPVPGSEDVEDPNRI